MEELLKIKEQDKITKQEIKNQKKEERSKNNSIAQKLFWDNNPLHGLSNNDIKFIISLLEIYKEKPTVPEKNSVGKIISYDRSFANVYSKELGTSHHKIFSIINGKKNRILKELKNNNKKLEQIIDEILKK